MTKLREPNQNTHLKSKKQILLRKLNLVLKNQKLDSLPNFREIAKILKMEIGELKRIFENKKKLERDYNLYLKVKFDKNPNRAFKMKSKNRNHLSQLIQHEIVISYYLWNYL